MVEVLEAAERVYLVAKQYLIFHQRLQMLLPGRLSVSDYELLLTTIVLNLMCSRRTLQL